MVEVREDVLMWFLRGKNSTILNITVQINIITRIVKCLKVNCGWNVTSN